MRWKIQIEGDEKYLEDLSNIFSALNFDPKIDKAGENYYLEGSIFESSGDAKEVLSKAKTLLTLISTTNFKPERNGETSKISRILYEDKNKKEEFDPDGNFISKQKISLGVINYEYKGSGKIKFSGRANTLATSNLVDSAVGNESIRILKYDDKGKIIGGLTTIEEINNYIKDNQNNSDAMQKLKDYLKPPFENIVKYSENFSGERSAKEMLTILTNLSSDLTTLKWIFLYRIYEIIEKKVGGKKKLKSKNWITPNQVDLFAWVANYYYRHSIFRVFKKGEPPPRTMPLSEAEGLISTLLSKYIESKASEIKNNRGES
jgi:hypothetical protein